MVGLQFSVVHTPEASGAGALALEPTEADVRRLALENAMRETGFTDNPKLYIDRLGLDAVDKVYREARRAQAANRGTKGEIKNFGGFLHVRLKDALERPTLFAEPGAVPGPKHLTGPEIQAAAEELVQGLARERTAAWGHWEALDEAALRKKVKALDPWTRENIRREGEVGPSFKGAVRRVLEDSGFRYPERLRGVRTFIGEEGLASYPGSVREKIVQVAVELE